MDLGLEQRCNICGIVSKMQVQLTFVVFLFLTNNGLCTGSEQAEDGMAEEILRSLFNSRVQQNKHSSYLGQMLVLNLCRMLARVSEPWQDDWYANKMPLDYNHKVSILLRQASQELYDPLILCRVLHPRELDQEYTEVDQKPLKRKSPYILKRQLHVKKARRPYILKRDSFY